MAKYFYEKYMMIIGVLGQFVFLWAILSYHQQ